LITANTEGFVQFIDRPRTCGTVTDDDTRATAYGLGKLRKVFTFIFAT
jgi:hypothetical protein